MKTPARSRMLLSLLLALVAGSPMGALGADPPVATFPGIVESESGGLRFPDGSARDSAVSAYAGVVVVAKSGGHFSSIQAALDSITGAGPGNRYLVRVAPGTYTGQVVMKPFVDIEGSGELTTRITLQGITITIGTVMGADDAELRFLTVESTGGGTFATAISNEEASPRLTHVTAIVQGATAEGVAIRNAKNSAPELTDVRAAASLNGSSIAIRNINSQTKLTRVDARAVLGTDANVAISNLLGSSATLRDVTALATGGDEAMAILNQSSTITATDLLATAQGGAVENLGLKNRGASLTIDGGMLRADGVAATALENTVLSSNPASADLRAVRLETSSGGTVLDTLGSTAAIRHSLLTAGVAGTAIAIDSFAPSVVEVAYSQVVGTVPGPSSQITCLGAYTGNLSALDADCQ